MSITENNPEPIAKTADYTQKTYFDCSSQYMSFYFSEAHNHNSNLRVPELFLYKCP